MEGRLNPWLQIWIQPREVINQQLERENREKYFILMVMVYGTLSVFTGYEQNDMDVNIGRIILISIVAGVLLGPLIFYFTSWLTAVVGRWIGGRGEPGDLRVATVRGAYIPGLAIIAVNLIQLAVEGKIYFVSSYAQFEAMQLGLIEGTSEYPLISILTYIAVVWTFVINVNAVGAAHGFSAWKALLLVVIIGFIIAIPLVLVTMLLVSFGLI
ncbi:YIP1 family protein [Alkalicoccobacillus plakortidis]|uniref:YIP1 family protein n=1 Tax=Alkalicoccobacillus plakortidis TaxID=444060 RepID=A0ABT0XN12_9BACI|nr:YIP1 family protein [Alkalicoccobacillus plakortidis]MCM2677297.1 YIP1 family protein [Alkalicoccobacillus plakortidis]